jgi:hypothetical protein
MGVQVGMRGKDLQKFLLVAREHNVIILVRHTNADSLGYIGVPGYYPKPAVIKAKTADMDPPPTTRLVRGVATRTAYHVAGLVVHPGFQPASYRGAKIAKAQDAWTHTIESLSPTLVGTGVNLDKSDSWSIWGVERQVVSAPRWKWRVDVDPASPRFGCLQLRKGAEGWCYIHGDYDLKDVIVLGHETDNRRSEGKIDGVKNYSPVLYELEYEKIREQLNGLIGADMVQHGAEAQFAWHGDEPITVAFPDWRHLLLYDAVTVQGWYVNLNRDVLASMGHDYRRDQSRMFHFGPNGLFAPGALPMNSWGT